MDSAVPAAMAMSMGWSKAAGSSAISVAAAAIRPRSQPARSCRLMADRGEANLLRGKIQIDDSYLIGELQGGRADRGSKNTIPIVLAVSLNEAGHPIYTRTLAVSGCSSEAIGARAREHPAPGS